MAFWQRMVLLYLAMAIGCAFWQPNIVFDNGETPLSFFNLDANNWNTTKSLSSNTDLSNSINRATQEGTNQQQVNTAGTTSFNPLNFIIDTTFAIIKFIKMLFNIIFAPFNIMVQGEFPVEVIYMLGIPIVFMMIIALFGWLKQG